jgi:DNA-binding CsgD family transcriptional regulator
VALVTSPSEVGLAGRSLATMSRIAGIAASGASADERTEEVLDELQHVFPFDAGMLSCVDPVTATRRQPIVARAYPDSFRDYLVGPEWHAECIEPFGLPRTGWPVREHDLPVDPMSLRGIAEYGRPAGLNEGLLSALITPEGQHTGFIMLSWANDEPPSNEACAVIGHLSLALANMVDPLQSARVLAASLDEGSTAVGLRTDGGVIPLRGTADTELVEPGSPLRRIVEQLLAERRMTVSFLWPRPAGSGWYLCRAFHCRDRLAVLTYRPHDGVYGLTRRELEVLTSLAVGWSNHDIAEHLTVTTRTVRAHVEHIFDKLEITTRSAAVARAVAEGLLLPRALRS